MDGMSKFSVPLESFWLVVMPSQAPEQLWLKIWRPFFSFIYRRGCAAGRGPAPLLDLEYFRVLSCSSKNLKMHVFCFKKFLQVSDDAGLADARPRLDYLRITFCEIILFHTAKMWRKASHKKLFTFTLTIRIFWFLSWFTSENVTLFLVQTFSKVFHWSIDPSTR